MTENESMPAHEKSWSDRELLTSILSRYCVVLEDLGGRTPTFLVSEKKDHDKKPVDPDTRRQRLENGLQV